MPADQPTMREYLRVSIDRSGTGKSPDEQHDEMTLAAERQGWRTHPNAYRDNNRSASRYARRTREDFETLMSDLREGRFDADILGIWESSRGSRQTTEWLALIDLCKNQGVLIWVCTHGRTYDPANARDRRTLREDASDAEYESDKTSERIQRSVRARAAEGRPHGKIPYGYRREYDPDTGALLRQVPNETTAPIVREIFTRIATRETYYSIAADLTRRGIPLPRPARTRHDKDNWTGTTVRGLADNPAYAGLRVHKGQIVGPATWPGLVTEDLWDAVQAVIAEARTRTSNPRGDSTARHLLTGIARCGRCLGPVRRIKNRGVPSYNCRYCLKLARRMDKIDQYVIDRLLSLLEEIDVDARAEDDTSSEELAAARDSLRGLQDRLDAFTDEAADGDLSPAALARIEARLAPQIAAAAAKVKALSAPSRLARYDLSDPHALWESLDLMGRRQLIRDAITVTILPTGVGYRGPACDENIKVVPNW